MQNHTALHMYLPRLTDTLPLPIPLPLDDVIPQLLTVAMKEKVSHRKGAGTTTKVFVICGKTGRSPLLRYGLMLGERGKDTSAFRSPEARGCNIPSDPSSGIGQCLKLAEVAGEDGFC